MIARLFPVIFALTAAQAQPGSPIDFRSVIHSFKGFMSGFQKGMYDDEFFKLTEDCFGTDEVNEKLMFLYEFTNGRESPIKIIEFVTTFQSVFMA